MIYKILGGALLLLAGGYVSLWISRFERRRLRVLDGYISLIYYIKGQIDCYAMPISDILAGVDPAIIAACLGLEGNVHVPRLGEGEESPLPGLVQESRLYLDTESERLLTTFTGELGRNFRAEQVSRCDYYVTALTEERKKLTESMPARIRACSILAVSAALAAAVLLW